MRKTSGHLTPLNTWPVLLSVFFPTSPHPLAPLLYGVRIILSKAEWIFFFAFYSFPRKIQAMERKLTDKQMHALRFIHDHIKNNGCAPTLREIGEAFGIPSTTAFNRRFYLLGHDCLRKTETETAEHGRNIELTEKGISLCESFSKK